MCVGHQSVTKSTTYDIHHMLRNCGYWILDQLTYKSANMYYSHCVVEFTIIIFFRPVDGWARLFTNPLVTSWCSHNIIYYCCSRTDHCTWLIMTLWCPRFAIQEKELKKYTHGRSQFWPKLVSFPRLEILHDIKTPSNLPWKLKMSPEFRKLQHFSEMLLNCENCRPFWYFSSVSSPIFHLILQFAPKMKRTKNACALRHMWKNPQYTLTFHSHFDNLDDLVIF